MLTVDQFVLDVDERVVTFINTTAQKNNLRISARVNDVRNPFPDDCRNQFDVFVTDPVETVEGIKLFFSHGISGLRGPGSVYVAVSYMPSLSIAISFCCCLAIYFGFQHLLWLNNFGSKSEEVACY